MVDSEERLAERVLSESAMLRQFEQRTVARGAVHPPTTAGCIRTMEVPVRFYC